MCKARFSPHLGTETQWSLGSHDKEMSRVSYLREEKGAGISGEGRESYEYVRHSGSLMGGRKWEGRPKNCQSGHIFKTPGERKAACVVLRPDIG